MRLVIGITGASGSIYAATLIRAAYPSAELHIVISDAGQKVFEYEMNESFESFMRGCKNAVRHDNSDLFADIASGSFKTDGMIIVPASMSTSARIAIGTGESLLCRAADVTIKEKRRLVVCPRESPLSSVHLKNLLELSNCATIFPLFPMFYARPATIDIMVKQSVSRVLALFDIECDNYFEWRNRS